MPPTLHLEGYEMRPPIALAIVLFWVVGAGPASSDSGTLPPLPPGLTSGSELGADNDTYIALHSFWSDDVISRFFKYAATGTLRQIPDLVAQLCVQWKRRDPHLPVTGRFTVPPGVELDLNNLCR